jgi:hypothetical protein
MIVALAAVLSCALAVGNAAAVPLLGDFGADDRIVNGVPTGQYPAVGVLLSGSSPSSAIMVCSGTLVGCRSFVTAAHCVCPLDGPDCQPPNNPSTGAMLVFVPHIGFVPVSEAIVHPDYDFTPPGSNFPRADIAVLVLGVSTTGVRPVPINTTLPAIPSSGTLVGFGRTGGGSKNVDFGIKRVGDVLTDNCNTPNGDHLMCWNFFGERSNTCNGDSGGPLFMDFGAGDVLAGVTSGGASSTCLPNDHSFDTNVGFYHEWVETVAGPDLQNTSCGVDSQVGDANNLEYSFTSSLGLSRPTETSDFLIAAGSDQLRIALNAQDDGDSDFDMFVKHGSPPTPTDFDCRQDGAGQFGFCQFSNPAGGSWYVRVDRASGAGEYQVTANDRNTQPSVCGNELREPGEQCDGTDDSACSGLCLGSCECPPPVCGNDVLEVGEECDGTADAACAGGCQGDCACPCLEGDVTVRRVLADAKRLLVKATIDNTSGAYDALDPRAEFLVDLDDGATSVAIDIPAGDSGWDRSKPERGRFRWKGVQDGLALVRIKDGSSRSGKISMTIKGKAVPGADELATEPLSIEMRVDGLCIRATLPQP